MKKFLQIIPVLLLGSAFIWLSFFNQIEVTSNGQGVTSKRNSDVSISLPGDVYISRIFVSQSDEITEGQPLLTYRNISDSHKLEQLEQYVNFLNAQLKDKKNESCVLNSDIFKDADNYLSSVNVVKKKCDASDIKNNFEGVEYIKGFYRDLVLEKNYVEKMKEKYRESNAQLKFKKNLLVKKKNILKTASVESLKYIDLQSELSNIEIELQKQYMSEIELGKKIHDKFISFLLRKNERLLTLEEEIESIEKDSIEQVEQIKMLREKEKFSIIRSPINGVVLKKVDGISEKTFMDTPNDVFVLKKKGSSEYIKAKFEKKYRKFLKEGREVVLKLNLPGNNNVYSGTIEKISHDAIIDEDSTDKTKRVYEVEIMPDKDFMKNKYGLGMDVQVVVVEDKITIMGYVLSVLPSSISFGVW